MVPSFFFPKKFTSTYTMWGKNEHVLNLGIKIKIRKGLNRIELEIETISVDALTSS